MGAKKLLVFADDEHKPAFDALFRGTGVQLHYVYDLVGSLYPVSILDKMGANLNKYDGAIICGCCGDNLPILTNKKVFPGKVIFFDYGKIHQETAIFNSEKNMVEKDDVKILDAVDLYLSGSQLPSEVIPKVKELLEIS